MEIPENYQELKPSIRVAKMRDAKTEIENGRSVNYRGVAYFQLRELLKAIQQKLEPLLRKNSSRI